ncbi:MAG: GIY-YIG nuclease family protein [Anaerolineae bacterium]
MAFAYMLRCRDGTLYVGWTVDLNRRLAQHQAGRGSRYTKGRRPVRLVYSEELATQREARQREAALRRLRAPAKRRLASANSPLSTG